MPESTWSGWSPLVRRWARDEEPGLPVKLGSCSNGEFAPRAPSPSVRRAVDLARRTCDDAARRLGMSRRDFLRTSMASAATLLALGACSDDEDPAAGTFEIPPDVDHRSGGRHVGPGRRRAGHHRRAAAPPRARRLSGHLRQHVPAGRLRRRPGLLRHRPLARPRVRALGHHDGRPVRHPGAGRSRPAVGRGDGRGPARRRRAVRRRQGARARPRPAERRSARSCARRHARRGRAVRPRGVEVVHARGRPVAAR